MHLRRRHLWFREGAWPARDRSARKRPPRAPNPKPSLLEADLALEQDRIIDDHKAATYVKKNA